VTRNFIDIKNGKAGVTKVISRTDVTVAKQITLSLCAVLLKTLTFPNRNQLPKRKPNLLLSL
jgi:hypothetical protein